MSQWKPIADLSPHECRLRDPAVEALLLAWSDQRDDVVAAASRHQFEQRLAREWAIETGVIEGVYDIDRGITEQLIEHGIDASLIPHGMAIPSGEFAARMAATHQEVLEGLFAFVKGERSLTTGYVKELHAVMTRDQEWAEGRDIFGNRMQVPLLQGAYKEQPNNPTGRSGIVHEYAPPVHVAAEMDRLIALHADHDEAAISPVVEAAWLHHRFTQIHPFQDGNGRVARSLASVVLIRAGGFPLVVTREMRGDYITALEHADAGDLAGLASLLGRRQTTDVVRALTCLPHPSAGLVSALAADWHALRVVAARLIPIATECMSELGVSTTETSASHVQGPEGMPHLEATAAATISGSHWSAASPDWWVRGQWSGEVEGRLAVWVEEVGHPYRGIMAMGALLTLVDHRHGPARVARESPGEPVFVCYRESAEAVEARFEAWVRGVLADAHARWRGAQP